MVSLASLAFVLLRLLLVKEKKKKDDSYASCTGRGGWNVVSLNTGVFLAPTLPSRNYFSSRSPPWNQSWCLFQDGWECPAVPSHCTWFFCSHFGTETITNSRPCHACTLCGSLQWAAVWAATRADLVPETPHPTKSTIIPHVSQMREGRSWFISKLAKLTLKWIIKF